MRVTIPVEEIRAGDRFVEGDLLHWTAEADAGACRVMDSDDEHLVSVPVKWGDRGGYGCRVWDPGTTIEIDRD